MVSKKNNIKIILVIFSMLLVFCASGEKREGSGAGRVLDSINGGPVVPREANKIIIPFFHNYTPEPSVAENLTMKLRRIIGMDGRLAVVAENEDADLRLAGAVVQYQVQPVQYDNFNEPVRKRMRIVASVRLFDLKSGREIFYDSGIQAFQLFSELIPPVMPEIQVQEQVLESLARRISVKVVEGWYTGLMTQSEKGKR